jgi:hypothetical protein
MEPRHLTQLVATSTAEYRVDTPRIDNRTLRSIDSDSQLDRRTPLTHQPSASPWAGSRRPHALQRTWRVDQASPAARRISKILPRSNPFAIPSSSLDDALAPLARFVMLFVLFTIAGTTILIAGKANRSKPVTTPPAAATTGPLLEPTTIIEPVRPAIEKPVAASTAIGPTGDTAARSRDDTDTFTLPEFPDVFATPTKAPVGAGESNDAQVTSDRPAEESSPAATALEFLTSPLTGTGRALPQVQTSEPPKAVAHLPGHILESPSRQASNDDQQSVY